MRQSELFPKTLKLAPKGAESINHQLLVRAGFVDQFMAGSWTLMPLGKMVVNKINKIISEELNKIGAQEILMPLMHPKNIWNETGRWDKADEIMYKLTDTRKRDFVLSFTHEEIFLDLARKHVFSYQDLPLALYHFSTKFRNEPRAKSGVLRGREFLMKDLYSLHTSQKDLDDFYWKVAESYKNIFTRIGFDMHVVEAGGGVFTDEITHEMQVFSESGEDIVYYCDKCDWAQNKEIFKMKEGDICPKCSEGAIHSSKSIELGNIFRFGTSYCEKMNFTYSDENGDKKYPYLGSYGIGTTRTMGTWVEVSHDERGIIWNHAISPFAVHLIELSGGNGEVIYNKLEENGIEVLWDNRQTGAGEKFADADLIGIPVRLVVSLKTEGKIEWKRRDSEKTELLEIGEVLDRLNF